MRAIAVAGAAVTLAACNSSGSGGVGGAATYGVLSCFTGRLASLGQAMLQGTRAAEREINAAGGVNGKQVGMVQADTGCD
ncbi:MAG: ABC transporter substrate-binding protein, partial [Jatrophihabitantaceae bacterium]